MVEHRAGGLARVRRPRSAGLLRAGHRDQLLPDAPERRYEVLDTYRPEFRYVTTSGWNREQLSELGLDAELISPGLDLRTFHPLRDAARRGDLVLGLGRSDPLKNLPLTLRRVAPPARAPPRAVPVRQPPELATDPGIRYITSPSDAEVNELLNRATVFLQTSIHEGFCLPVLESMATGGAVVCTDAHGNRDYCTDGVNCLMPDPTPAAVAGAVARLLADADLRRRLGEAGGAPPLGYDWRTANRRLERFLLGVARSTGPRPRVERSG